MKCDAETVYSWIRDLPVIDWHNHLDPAMLAADRPLGSLYEVWVKPDPYKHRAMRICGVPERLITGDASDGEKFAAWQAILPKLVGNPIFVWARQELLFLGLDPESYLHGQGENVSLSQWTPSKLLRKFNVAWMSPCITPADLPHWVGCARIVPSLRMNFGEGVSEETLEGFAAVGCRVVDVSVDDPSTLTAGVGGFLPIAAFAAAHGWTMLLHIGALRSTSARLRRVAGPAGGFAGMAAPCDPKAVAQFLDALEAADALPRTILMTLNPEAHAQLAILSGSFVGEGLPGKVQLGPAWWWCDHREGIFDVFEKNAAYGVLSTFIGMTTDSRSLLSFVRHDYFRRLLARWVAQKVADGDFPDDEEILRPLMENICYRNAAQRVRPLRASGEGVAAAGFNTENTES